MRFLNLPQSERASPPLAGALTPFSLCLCASVAIWAFLCLGIFSLALEVPRLARRVTDQAGLLTPDQIAHLENKLANLEQSDSTQIAVLIIPTLEDEALEDYAHRVASQWRLGRQGRDNGALLLIAMKERRMRIEVGYGLEPVLTDALSSRILRERITPNFRTGNFYGGIDAGITGMIEAVRGTYQAPPPTRPSSNIAPVVFTVIPLVLFVTVLYVIGRHSSRRKRHPGLIWIPGSTHRSEDSSSSGGSDFSSGGSSSGGGFSGGGGSFGGGGASGSW